MNFTKKLLENKQNKNFNFSKFYLINSSTVHVGLMLIYSSTLNGGKYWGPCSNRGKSGRVIPGPRCIMQIATVLPTLAQSPKLFV